MRTFRLGLLAAILLLMFAGGARAQFLTDSFAGTAGTALTAHTSTSGAAWVEGIGNGFSGGVANTGAGHITLTGSSSAFNSGAAASAITYANITLTGAEYDINFNLVIGATGIYGTQSVWARYDSATGNGYTFEFAPGGVHIRVYYGSANAIDLSSATYSFAASTTYAIKIQVRNSA